MTAPTPATDYPVPTSSRPRPRARPVALLLVLALGMGLGLGLGIAMPRAAAADPPPTPADTGLPDGFAVYRQALDIVREHFVDAAGVDDRALVEGSVWGMVAALGDHGHTAYLTVDELAAQRDALNGIVNGIGVSVDDRGGGLTIIAVIDGSPADRAGIRTGDRIEAIDGTRTVRLPLDELVRLVRGDPGTRVVLRIRRGGEPARDVPVVRARVEVPPVTWAFAPGTRVAVIRLVQFGNGAAAQVADAARETLGAEASAVVLDLRGNPGGLLAEATAIASTFLDDGVIYVQRDQDGDEVPVRAAGEAVIPDLPLAILVDEGSASSSEIVAAALQEAGRARVVGTPTFGTGTVLQDFPLADGSAIRLGVLRWLTPDGRDVSRTGLDPDVPVELPVGAMPISPDELRDLTRRGFSRSGDRHLRAAVRLLREREAAPAG